MYDAPGPIPKDEWSRQGRATLWYLFFWLLSFGLIVDGGFAPPFMPQDAGRPYPYSEVLVFCAITAVECAALYWVLGQPSMRLRAALLAFAVVCIFGLSFWFSATDQPGHVSAFWGWTGLLGWICLFQLIVALRALLERRA